jgi:hypothetical protein
MEPMRGVRLFMWLFMFVAAFGFVMLSWPNAAQ